jgi:hypothetical protein
VCIDTTTTTTITTITTIAIAIINQSPYPLRVRLMHALDDLSSFHSSSWVMMFLRMAMLW